MGNITRAFPVTLGVLAVVWAVYAAQFAVLPALGVAPWSEAWTGLFVATRSPSASWVLAPLAHAGIGHVLSNTALLAVAVGASEVRHGSARTLAYLGVALYLPLAIGVALAGGVVALGASLAGIAMLPVGFVVHPARSPITGERVTGGKHIANVVGSVAVLAGLASVLRTYMIHGRTGAVPVMAIDASHVGHAMGVVAGVVLLAAHCYLDAALSADRGAGL